METQGHRSVQYLVRPYQRTENRPKKEDAHNKQPRSGSTGQTKETARGTDNTSTARANMERTTNPQINTGITHGRDVKDAEKGTRFGSLPNRKRPEKTLKSVQNIKKMNLEKMEIGRRRGRTAEIVTHLRGKISDYQERRLPP